MNLYLFDQTEIITFTLPGNKIGNFWMTDKNGKNIININAENNEWVISGSNLCRLIFQNNYVENIIIKNKNYYVVEKNNIKCILFVDDVRDCTYSSYKIISNVELTVGSGQNSVIMFNNGCLQERHIVLKNMNSYFLLEKNNDSLVYVNDVSVVENQYIVKNGDIINLYGLKIVPAFGILFINNPLGNVVVNQQVLSLVKLAATDEISGEELEDIPMYSDEEYFLKSPRLRRIIETLDMKIDSPPSREEEKNMPMIYTIGPMLTMAASSVVNLSDTLSRIGDGERTLKDSAPSLVISGAMICSMLVWPFLTRTFERKQRKKKEEKRQLRYKSYIEKKRKEIQDEYNRQIQILEESLLSNDVCYDTIVNKKRTLWERKIEQGDFLTVRVGTGQIPFDAKINYHTEDFSMEDDNLIKLLEEMVEQFKILNNVPIGYSFAENNITAINGLYPKVLDFVYNCLMQMMAYHSYDNLKIVVFTNDNNKKRWEFLKNSLYCFSDNKDIRFFATNSEDMQEVSLYLDKIFQYRKSLKKDKDSEKLYMAFDSYYLFIIDDIDVARKINIIDNVLDEKSNLGFGMIILENKLSKLPSECNNFISIGDRNSGILKNDITSHIQIRFNDEVENKFNMEYISYILSNLPIYVESKGKAMKDSVTFLEMFGVGQVEQLNSLNRWKSNDPTKSLKTRVGYDENNDLFVLDLHEKQHGPHGLVAGMTGSGKSEFIITYVLSMAVNYSPEEVAFVLIDYKGGGLTGAFENKETGMRLPHVVGTITNLDKSEINRSLASIKSELRRRQEKFNEVRELTGENTVDIYKYQKMYRNGIVSEPMPHLIIVSDEFAELKVQQPAFMEDLISTARIGRSLGVHLILATQKPSGVVDAQIWSNSKFKICLKVQDKEDSMEMIKCADAAELKNVGRFFLQVGYNEYFALGQSAWTGASYFPSKEFKKQVDKNIYFINDVGAIYNAINNSDNKKNLVSNGEELANILKYIIDVSNSLKLNIRKLWLDRIPALIYFDNLIKKYNYTKKDYIINPIIGEYDDPANQSQGMLTLPITTNGNAIIYGMADSGRDEFLQGLVYSIINTHAPEEVNLYLLDYGAETMINFKDAPQVGDVILNSDDEKLNNFVKLLNTDMKRRKKAFIQYNGNYIDFIKMSDKKLPNIVVVVNLIENLTDNNLELFEKLFPIIRDGSKYGIHFVMTTTSQTSVRAKVAQTCKQILCLQLNTEIEYRDILGKTDGLVPSKCLGRGLIKLDKICEFQTLSIAPDEEKVKKIKDNVMMLLSNIKTKAKNVPMMPDVIRLDRFIKEYEDLTNVPLGVKKEDLGDCTYDFSKHVINLISMNEIEYSKGFVKNLLKAFTMRNSFNKCVVDACNYFDEYDYNIELCNSNFNEFIDKVKVINDDIKTKLEENNNNIKALKNMANNVYVILGIEKFYSKLDEEHKKIFKEILSFNREVLKINFIFIDIVSAFKKYEYEEWYKTNVDNDDGIWLGFGVSQQSVIKILLQSSKISSIEKDYCVLIQNGMPTVIKYINEFK